MPDERTLLERLGRPRGGGALTMGENTRELTRSVLRNLQRILNTRVGHAPAQMDMGTPPPCEMALVNRDGLAGIVRSLKECIEKYEPRLSGVEIAHVEVGDEILTLRFQVTARLIVAQGGATISFDTVVNPGGRIRLQT